MTQHAPLNAPFSALSLRSLLTLSLTLFTLSLLSACTPTETRRKGGSCKSDDDCLSGWVCEANFCMEGERSASEVAAREAKEKAAREAKKKAELAKKTTTKPGEGRLSVKICPYFRNVSSSAGSVVATHTETKQRHIISLQMEVPKESQQSEFTFYSLPLGEYEVYATYGLQVDGKFDTHRLKCDPKATKRACRGDELRVVKVTLPSEPDKTAGECDWVAE
jgi:hypothetical protein